MTTKNTNGKSSKVRSQNELIKEVATRSGMSVKDTKSVVDTLGAVIGEDLKTYGAVIVPQVGRLKAVDKPAGTARNPRTGETVEVKARKRVSFKASKTLTDSFAPANTAA